ncbi:hypothetical protein KPH14_000925 [Odynerus spinipes]|uniref:CCHC-type domain-containing protein n=1 Tax=Odynerus spinipes TaxID=1348599 RepID=A0AAD9RF38_9HYME|nr:hypothetical protein KPH14_000925 [Odynerus spinipes]
MKELASRGKIETAALIQYVSDGITDDPNRKIFLYEARDLKELRDKLEIFDKIMMRVSQQGRYSSNHTEMAGKAVSANLALLSIETKGDAARVVRCFNCNEAGHVMSSCPKPKRARGSCYICGAGDHQVPSCPRRKISVQPRPTTSSVEDKTTRLVEINDVLIPSYSFPVNLDIGNMIAVVDTGSPLSLLNETQIPTNIIIYPYLGNSNFTGANQSPIKILGRLKQKVKVQDCEIFIDFLIVL